MNSRAVERMEETMESKFDAVHEAVSAKRSLNSEAVLWTRTLVWCRDQRDFDRFGRKHKTSTPTPRERVSEPAPERRTLVKRPCQIVTHTFASGGTVSRCLGVHVVRIDRDGNEILAPCAYASGHQNKSLNNRKHVPDLMAGIAAVDDDAAEPQTSVLDALEQSEVKELGAELKTVIAAGPEPEVCVENDDGSVESVPVSELQGDDSEDDDIEQDDELVDEEEQ